MGKKINEKYKELYDAKARIDSATKRQKSVSASSGSLDKDFELLREYYDKAVSLYERKTLIEVWEAFDIFTVLGNYERSAALRRECGRFITGRLKISGYKKWALIIIGISLAVVIALCLLFAGGN